jgi:hypothetical protein
MSDIENEAPSVNVNGKRINALELGPRKKAYVYYLSDSYGILNGPR